jgi:hypothetical protein
MTRLVLVLAVSAACSSEDVVLPYPVFHEADVARREALVPLQYVGLMPQWREGDAWVVRRRTEHTTRSRKVVVTEFDWEYRVEWIAGGSVAITATHVNTIPRGTRILEGTTRLLYRMNAELVEVKVPKEHDRFAVEPNVHFPAGRSRMDDFAGYWWPQFPLVEASRVEFEEGFDQSVAREGDALRVTVNRRYEADQESFVEEPPPELVQTMEQVWEANRPWWSSIRVYARGVARDGHLGNATTFYEASVIEWRPAKH